MCSSKTLNSYTGGGRFGGLFMEWLIQGRIIHEAGEAEASIRARTARYNENLESRTNLGPGISTDKICIAVF